MAAGLGFKTFTTGEVLTAADVNGYLMQGVLVFASEAARNSAITSPQEGQFAYTKDNNSLWYYTGSAWAASGATGDIEGVTAGTGISGGGTSGTVTITNDMATTITASGDIVVGTGSGTYDNLPIGSTGQVLTADTTVSPYKVKWATPAGGTFPVLTVSKYASDFSTSSTTFTDMTGYSITRTPVSATNKIEIKLTFTFVITQATSISIKLFAGATSLLENAWYEAYDGGSPKTLVMVGYAENVAASSTVFKAQIKVSAGTITVYGTNTGYASNYSTLEIY
jgi:hypothetical protein